MLSDEYKQLSQYIIGGAAFLDNFLALNQVGYFDEKAELKPLLHLWSLGIEEQFYLFGQFLFGWHGSFVSTSYFLRFLLQVFHFTSVYMK